MATGLRGTFSDNKRPVITTAPDALVYINGELSLPSGAAPGRRVNIQPLVTSISANGGVEQSPGTAQLSLHIPTHHEEDFFRGGQLILTNMMEVRIYMKGHFLVGGVPRYYPVFWGVVTSVSHSWSGGERTVELSCQDVLYWWTIQRIVTNASYMGADAPAQGAFNLKGSGVFTNMNPFDTIYSLARHAYGDAVLQEFYLGIKQNTNEPNPVDNKRLMWYWTKQWGRIAFALRMYGPRGDLLQGDLLSSVLSDSNKQSALFGRVGLARRNRQPQFQFNDEVNLEDVSAFSEVLSRLGSIDLHTSEHQTKKEIADTVKESIGYEFFLDMTGEIIFKPPFYNLDVMSNKPVSWIRPVDIINENFAENIPDVTFLEGTGSLIRNLDVGAEEITKPKATYIDYRLVQKYGWKPGSYNSEFFGSGLGGDAPRNLFYHLVDQLDKQNSRIHTGSVTIPLRPELRLGYPIYYEDQDAFYYVDNIAHQFSYGGQCTTTLNLMAKRAKFYAAFPYWNGINGSEQEVQDPDQFGSRSNQEFQPSLGDTADPGDYPNNLYRRPVSAQSGDPVPDRNVILTAVEKEATDRENVENDTFSAVEGEQTRAESVATDLVSMRSQFRVIGNNDFMYTIDPTRDETLRYDEQGRKTSGPLTSLKVERKEVGGENRILPTFPVSDERGYEVIGGYEYGRTVRLTRNGMDFSRQTNRRASELANLSPERTTTNQTNEDMNDEQFASNAAMSDEDRVAKLDPNNYGRRLLDLRPSGPDSFNFAQDARNLIKGRTFQEIERTLPSSTPGDYDFEVGPSDKPFTRNTQVGQWREVFDEVRSQSGVSAEEYPDTYLLAIIHTESNGRTDARRTNDDGRLSQYCGLVQSGVGNSGDLGRENTDFLGNGPNDREVAIDSLNHMIEYTQRYRSRHNHDPDRMAILWKGGGTTLDRFNAAMEESPTTAVGILSAKNGTDVYVARVRLAMSVWSDPNGTVVEEPLPSVEDVNTDGIPPETGDDLEARRASNTLFGNALAANRDQGINSLPSGIRPVRDPGLMVHITSFLQAIYAEGFALEKELERKLRGETKIPNRNSPVRPGVQTEQDRLVDTSLGRPEVQDALASGQTPSEVFGPGGEWQQVQEQWGQAKSTFRDVADTSGTDVNGNVDADVEDDDDDAEEDS